MEVKRIVFVCVGNMCRSQMAEGLARHMGGDNVWVESAGTHPTGSVSSEARACLAELGIDIADQWSKGLSEADLAGADVVVSMARVPARELVPRGSRGRLIDWDVGDPIGYPVEIFRVVRRDLTERVKELLKELGVDPLPVGDDEEEDEDEANGDHAKSE